MIELQNKRFQFVNYEFRPDSYWNDEKDPLSTILKNVKGTQRREMIKDFWDQGKFELLDDTLLKDELDDKEREGLGKIHPSFMGGEYLPEYLPLETEIARIELQSTTADVISVRARPIGEERIGYRIVDEYESNYKGVPETSAKPLTLEELIQLIDYDYNESGYGGFGIGYNVSNAEWADDTDLRNFTTVSSFTYMDLFDHYDAIHEEWWEGVGLVE